LYLEGKRLQRAISASNPGRQTGIHKSALVREQRLRKTYQSSTTSYPRRYRNVTSGIRNFLHSGAIIAPIAAVEDKKSSFVSLGSGDISVWVDKSIRCRYTEVPKCGLTEQSHSSLEASPGSAGRVTKTANLKTSNLKTAIRECSRLCSDRSMKGVTAGALVWLGLVIRTMYTMLQSMNPTTDDRTRVSSTFRRS
jgi:hypothetical protein